MQVIWPPYRVLRIRRDAYQAAVEATHLGAVIGAQVLPTLLSSSLSTHSAKRLSVGALTGHIQSPFASAVLNCCTQG